MSEIIREMISNIKLLVINRAKEKYLKQDQPKT